MIFKKDSPLLGLSIGIIVPVFCYYLLDWGIFLLLKKHFSSASVELFALVFNLPLLRYYLINLKFEKTGKGILFATFFYALIWVYFNQGLS